MIRNRSLILLLLGAWLGASILVDIAVTQNFQTVDRFLASPENPAASDRLNAMGQDRARLFLRRNAAEENNWIFTNWERAELGIGALLILMLAVDERRRRLALAAAALALAIVAAERLLLTPRITTLGRVIDGLTPADPRYRTFWMLHGFYSGLDILKMLLIFGLGARLASARGTAAAASQEALVHSHG